MRCFTIALLSLPLFVFGQDSWNTNMLSRLSVASGPELGRIDYRGGYVFAPEVPEGLHIVDARDPAHPREIALLETGDEIYDVAVFGDYAFATSASSGLRVIDVSNPAAPIELAVNNNIGGWHIDIVGTYAFLTGLSALSILDLSIPTAPVLVGTYDPPGDFWYSYPVDIGVVGDYAYVACADSGVRILDISDMTNPTEVGVYRTDHRATRISVYGERLYVVDSPPADWGGVDVVDITNPAAPVLLGEFEPSDVGFTDIQAHGDYFVAATKSLHGLRVYNVADPENFQEIGWHNLYWYCHQIILVDNLVYANDQFGVAIYDISAALPIEEHSNVIVENFSLHPIYPNPFNNTANISFDLPREVTGRLVVYDVLGRMTNTLYDGKLAAGTHSMQFNGNGLSSGTYFVRLETPDFSATQKAVLLK